MSSMSRYTETCAYCVIFMAVAYLVSEVFQLFEVKKKPEIALNMVKLLYDKMKFFLDMS